MKKGEEREVGREGGRKKEVKIEDERGRDAEKVGKEKREGKGREEI